MQRTPGFWIALAALALTAGASWGMFMQVWSPAQKPTPATSGDRALTSAAPKAAPSGDEPLTPAPPPPTQLVTGGLVKPVPFAPVTGVPGIGPRTAPDRSLTGRIDSGARTQPARGSQSGLVPARGPQRDGERQPIRVEPIAAPQADTRDTFSRTERGRQTDGRLERDTRQQLARERPPSLPADAADEPIDRRLNRPRSARTAPTRSSTPDANERTARRPRQVQRQRRARPQQPTLGLGW